MKGKGFVYIVYYYDTGGERGVRYVPRQSEGEHGGVTAGYAQDMDIMLYPNVLVTVRAQELNEEFNLYLIPKG